MAETSESFSQSYFSVSRHLRQTEKAMDFLKQRRATFGARSGAPVRTLYWAYSCLNQLPDAFKMLDSAVEERPGDGSLLLFASDAHARYGHYDIAADLLQKAESCSRRTAWLRQKAELAGYLCDFAEALRLWRLLLEVEPLAEDVNRAVARLLAETEGRDSAVAHLQEVCRQFPHNIMLHKIRFEWLQDGRGVNRSNYYCANTCGDESR